MHEQNLACDRIRSWLSIRWSEDDDDDDDGRPTDRQLPQSIDNNQHAVLVAAKHFTMPKCVFRFYLISNIFKLNELRKMACDFTLILADGREYAFTCRMRFEFYALSQTDSMFFSPSEGTSKCIKIVCL